MTRINCVPVKELTSKHLLAEYRELPRVFKLARPPKAGEVFPTEYTMGAGHVKFFYDKLLWCTVRFTQLVNELIDREYSIRYTELPKIDTKPDNLWNLWSPSEKDMEVNRERIRQRLSEMEARRELR